MKTDPDCIFCRIVAGEIPCCKVFESEDALAFLDIGPLSHGHTLLIPKEHYSQLHEMPESLASRIGTLLPVLGKAISQATEAEGYNLLQNNGKVAGQEVMHLHFHLIPRSQNDNLGYRWNTTKYSEGQIEEIRDRIETIIGT